MVLQLRRVHPVLGVVRRVLVEVWHEDRLRVRRLDVFAGAAVAVAAGADFLGTECQCILGFGFFFFFWQLVMIKGMNGVEGRTK